MLRGVGGAPNPDYAGTVPQQSFMLFQMMFAIIITARAHQRCDGGTNQVQGLRAVVLLWITVV